MALKVIDIHSLPIYPSTSTVLSLPPSQRSSMLDRVSSTLQYALSLPDAKLSKVSSHAFVLSYANDGASLALHSLVFPEEQQKCDSRSSAEKLIRRQVLSLAKRLAALPKAGGLTTQTLLDLCVLYGSRNATQMRELLNVAFQSHSLLLHDIQYSAIPAFSAILLSNESGLHALRKIVVYIESIIRCAPRALLDVFSSNIEFILTLAKCYDTRLSDIAVGYGGIRIEQSLEFETPTLWVECKIALMDCFNILLQHILKCMTHDPRTHTEITLRLIFELFSLPQSPASSRQGQVPTPFLNRSLLADYQDAYSLSTMLAGVLANRDDPRVETLAAALKAFEEDNNSNETSGPGALKILLRSRGIPLNIDYRGVQAYPSKGKERAVAVGETPQSSAEADFNSAVSSILDILPDQESEYIHGLLELPQYGGDAERVLAALLEGEAPAPSALRKPRSASPVAEPVLLPVRRNVFDEQPFVSPTEINIGKRNADAESLLRDRSFMEQMKTGILRRVEELSDSDAGTDKDRASVVTDLDDEDQLRVVGGGIRVRGTASDGYDSAGRDSATEDEREDEEENSAVRAESEEKQTPETICELAYLQDPEVFNRDANTRRSKARADLRAQAGWSDEQLEGWRIMLERNPKKDKILQKHEYSRNTNIPVTPQGGPSTEGGSSRQDVDRGFHGRGFRGRGGRGGRGRSRGRGGGNHGGTDHEKGGDARERAWKDKNKARQANHNRKRGHDKKMARGGALPG